jgi:hypothetical protein
MPNFRQIFQKEASGFQESGKMGDNNKLRNLSGEITDYLPQQKLFKIKF